MVFYGGMDVQRLIIEASQTFTSQHISNAVAVAGSFGSVAVGDYSAADGNPQMPAPMHGIMFDNTTGTTLRVMFQSARMPVWGDFYAKGGKSKGGKGKGKGVYNAVWNAGFSAANPTALASNGSLLNHILVPDTAAGPVPEPAAMVFLGLGGLIALRSRKSPSAQ